MKKILIILLAFGLFSHALCAEQTTPAPAQEATATSANKTKQIVTIVTALAKRLSINSRPCVAANPALSAATTASFAIPVVLFLGWLLFLATANGVFLGDEIVHQNKVSQREDKKDQQGDGWFTGTGEESKHKKLILHFNYDKEEYSLMSWFYHYFVPGLMSLSLIIIDKSLPIGNHAYYSKFLRNCLLCHIVQIILVFLAVPTLTAILLALLVPAGIAIDTLLAFTAYKNIPAIKNKNLGVVLLNEFKTIVAKIKAARAAKAHATA